MKCESSSSGDCSSSEGVGVQPRGRGRPASQRNLCIPDNKIEITLLTFLARSETRSSMLQCRNRICRNRLQVFSVKFVRCLGGSEGTVEGEFVLSF